MATLKQRLCRKNSAGTYDMIYLETSSDMVIRSSNANQTVEAGLAAVESKATTNAGNVSSLQSTVSGHTTQIAGLTTRVGTAETNIGTNAANIAKKMNINIADDTLSSTYFKIGFENGAMYVAQV